MRQLVFPVLAVALMGQSSNPAPTPSTLNLGDPMPAFSLPRIDGQNLDSKWIQGPILVVFLSVKCPIVKASENQINALAKAFGASIPFIAINSAEGEGIERMRRQAEEKKFVFNYLRDESQGVARAYGVQSTPDFFLFNRGKLVYHGRISVGSSDPNAPMQDLMAALKAVEGGFTPNPNQVPSEGCPTRWKAKG